MVVALLVLILLAVLLMGGSKLAARFAATLAIAAGTVVFALWLFSPAHPL